jgi:hypothetical protein
MYMMLATLSFLNMKTHLPIAPSESWELYHNKKYGFSFWHSKHFWATAEYKHQKKIASASQFLLAGPEQFIQVQLVQNDAPTQRADSTIAFRSYPHGEEVILHDIVKDHAAYYLLAKGNKYSVVFYDFVDPYIPLSEKKYYADLQKVVQSVVFFDVGSRMRLKDLIVSRQK